jgi:tetratricopeptide (TPR) repeat protein
MRRKLAVRLLRGGQPEEAIRVIKAVFASLRGEAVPPREAAKLHRTLGLSFDSSGDATAAAKHLADALALAERAGEAKEEIAALDALSSLARDRGDLKESVNLCSRLIGRERETEGYPPYLVANSLTKRGGVYLRLREIDAALADFEKAREIQTGAFGGAHIDVAGSLNNIGTALVCKKEYDAAVSALSKALEITSARQEGGGETHLSTLLNLAHTHAEMGDAARFEAALDKFVAAHAWVKEFVKFGAVAARHVKELAANRKNKEALEAAQALKGSTLAGGG